MKRISIIESIENKTNELHLNNSASVPRRKARAPYVPNAMSLPVDEHSKNRGNFNQSASRSVADSNSTPSSIPRLNLDVLKPQNPPDLSSQSSNQQLTTGFSTKRSFTD